MFDLFVFGPFFLAASIFCAVISVQAIRGSHPLQSWVFFAVGAAFFGLNVLGQISLVITGRGRSFDPLNLIPGLRADDDAPRVDQVPPSMCPDCGYSFVGLTKDVERCPECGSTLKRTVIVVRLSSTKDENKDTADSDSWRSRKQGKKK